MADNAGALAAVVTAASGWFFAGFTSSDDGRILMIHRWLGKSAALLALGTLWLSEQVRRRRLNRNWFRMALFVVAALVLGTGFFGGAMVYGIDHYAWP